MKILRILLPVTIACLFAGGCAKWYNPNLVDQANHEALLNKDKAICEKYAKDLYHTGPMNLQQKPTVGMRHHIDDYELGITENRDQETAFIQCMQGRGWQKK